MPKVISGLLDKISLCAIVLRNLELKAFAIASLVLSEKAAGDQ